MMVLQCVKNILLMLFTYQLVEQIFSKACKRQPFLTSKRFENLFFFNKRAVVEALL